MFAKGMSAMPRASKKRSVPFPFDLLVLLVRPNDTPEITCMFCQQEAEYRLDHFMRDLPRALDPQGSGLLDIDAMWREGIHRQVEGDFTPTYYQVVCLDCCIHFAAIQLGRRRPIQYLLTMASIARRQKGVDLSLAILCTVDSWQDEGDLWAINAPSIDAEAVMQHVNNLGRETAKAEEPQPKEGEEEWKQRFQKRQRLLELRAEEIKASESLRLFLDTYKDLEQKEQQQGRLPRLIRVITYALFGPWLDTPEKEKLYKLIEALNQQIEGFQAEQQVLAKELRAEPPQAQDGAKEEEEKE
jgi:hypothetical protein